MVISITPLCQNNLKEIISYFDTYIAGLGSVPECAFPGKEIYCGAQTLLALNDVYKFFFSNDR